MHDRVLAAEGIHNFRDYGGYPARGGRLRTGQLWRSGQHAGATPADLDTIHELGIVTVVDLRGDSERKARPCLRHQDFSGDVLFAPGETAYQAGGRALHEVWADQVQTADQALDAMRQLYRGLPFRPPLVHAFGLYLAALAERDGPSLLHCVAGKDRTGVGVALVHTLLGVHPDDVMADYLLTNTAGNQERRIAALRSQMPARSTLNDAALQVLLGVDPAFLDAALAAIRDQAGSIEAYAAGTLGADATVVAAMAARLIV